MELPETTYGVLYDDEGSCDYFDTAADAHSYARPLGLQVVRVTVEAVDCICYMFWEPRCEIHGY